MGDVRVVEVHVVFDVVFDDSPEAKGFYVVQVVTAAEHADFLFLLLVELY